MTDLYTTYLTSTNSTFSNLYSLNSQFTNITVSNFITTGNTFTNLVINSITTNNLVASSMSGLDVYGTKLLGTNLTTTNIFTTLVSQSSLISTNLQTFASTMASLIPINTLRSTSNTSTHMLITQSTVTNTIPTTIIRSTAGTMTNLALTQATIGSLSIGNLTSISNTLTNLLITRNTTTTLNIASATDSTSTTSGAMIVAGGIGIVKNLYVNSAILRQVTNISYYLTGAQTLTNNTDMALLFNSSAYNNQGTGITYDSGTGKFTNTTSRTVVFLVMYAIGFVSNTSGVRFSWIGKNSSSGRFAQNSSIPLGSSNPTTLNGCAPIVMNNTTDFVQIWVYQNSGGNLNTTSGNGGDGCTVSVAIL